MSKEDAILNGIYTSKLCHILHPVTLAHMAREWLKEDTPNFDYGGFVVGEREESAVLLMKSQGSWQGDLSSMPYSKNWTAPSNGRKPKANYWNQYKVLQKVSGRVRQILLGERVALNCISRASGIASAARRLHEVAKKNNWSGEIAGTRKTTPGFRLVEKYALLVGGISTHRYDLSSMIMLKDNHIWTAGSITQVIPTVKLPDPPPPPPMNIHVRIQRG